MTKARTAGFRLHQVAGLDIYGVVAERLEIAVFLSPFTLWANVAQLVEQRFRKARVVSSILTVGSKWLICIHSQFERSFAEYAEGQHFQVPQRPWSIASQVNG